MKLRNKKTGEVCLLEISEYGYLYLIMHKDGEGCQYIYNSLAELNDEWEDAKPDEPLIKDNKIRKAVKVWADANNITKVEYDKAGGTLVALHNPAKISFNGSLGVKADEWAILGIAELCGEEEE